MVGFAQVLAAVALIGVVVWVFAEVALRLGGWVALASGLVVAVTGGGAARAWGGVAVAAAGVLVWLAGQAHFVIRHGFHASPLTRRLFRIRPLRAVDPAVRWHATRRPWPPLPMLRSPPLRTWARPSADGGRRRDVGAGRWVGAGKGWADRRDPDPESTGASRRRLIRTR